MTGQMLGRETCRVARRRRGVGFVFFLLVALPFLLASSALTADVTRLMVAHRQVASAAESAAVAAAFEHQPGRLRLDQAAARQAASDTFQAAQRANVMSLAGRVTLDNPSIGSHSVRINVTYDVPGLVFADMFSSGVGNDLQVMRTAEICRPNGPTDGFCARPLPWR